MYVYHQYLKREKRKKEFWTAKYRVEGILGKSSTLLLGFDNITVFVCERPFDFFPMQVNHGSVTAMSL